ncbi:MAG: DUF3696 domain-containing protein [bacterium]
MITKINVEGFKLHAKTSIDAKPITIFIGPNNSGKSSLIQAIQLLCQTSPEKNIFIPEVKKLEETSAYLSPYKIDVGRFEDVIRKESATIGIKLRGNINGSGLSLEVTIENNEVKPSGGRDFLFQGIAKKLLASCYFIYPLRGFEEAGYLLPDQPPEKYSTLENVTLNDRIVALIAAFAYNANLRKEVAQELSQIMGYGIDIDIQWIGSNRVTILLKQPANTLMVNEGSGFQQMIFILLPLILIPDNSTVFIQEPEAHIHPKAQVDLGRLLIKFLKKKNIQLFIETHSEHILHAFIHSIAKKDISNNELAVYYFENKEGRAEVRNIEVDKLGRVKGGFPGFFDQSLNELTEFLEAIRGREK